MKNFKTLFSTIALAASTTLATGGYAQSIDCANFPNQTATQTLYASTCYRLNNFQNHDGGAVRYADSLNLHSHLWFDNCYYFGRNVGGDGSIALCWGRDVDTTNLGHAISNPTGKMYVTEFSSTGPVDMVRVWTWDGTTKTVLDSASAFANLAPLDDGFYHHITVSWTPVDLNANWPGDPNANRLKVEVDGVQRLSFQYDAPTLLFGGDTTMIAWCTGEAFTPGCKVQEVCLFTDVCPAVVGPTIACVPQANLNALGEIEDDETITSLSPDSKLTVEIYPNPVTESKVKVKVATSTTYIIVDAAGAVAQKGEIEAGENILTIDNLIAGTYCLVATNPETGEVVTKKFVILP